MCARVFVVGSLDAELLTGVRSAAVVNVGLD